MKKDGVSGFLEVPLHVLFAEAQKSVETNVETVFGFGRVKGIRAFVFMNFGPGSRRSNARKMLPQTLMHRRHDDND